MYDKIVIKQEVFQVTSFDVPNTLQFIIIYNNSLPR